jgi:hypothetical protein
MSLNKITMVSGLRPTLRPLFNYAELARNATYAPQLAAIGAKVFAPTPDVPWNTLSATELQVIRLLDGVMPVALVETMTKLSADELYLAIAILLARGFIVECRAPIGRPPFLKLVVDRGSVIPLSTADFIDVQCAA